MSRPGRLFMVGLGPGSLGVLTPQAREALCNVNVIVGYTAYFQDIADLVAEKECLALPLGQETERARLAVERACRGQAVAVISSGDAGIYGMAGVVLELLARLPETDLPEVTIIPGVSAINAAASLLGAPLGHDFAVISLSDLLTPWETIERKLHAAAAADFVLALLNPRSRRRDWQLARAREMLLEHREPDTPVGVVRNAFRPGQTVVHTTLDAMTGCDVDMLTTVIVGNRQTRFDRSWMVTPRGYSLAALGETKE